MLYGAPPKVGGNIKSGGTGCNGCAGVEGMRSSRRAWNCPDEHPPRPPGREMPVPPSRQLWPHCPVYSLRIAAERLPAEHLIDGYEHPAILASMAAAEIESGGARFEDFPAKLAELALLWRSESAEKREADWKRDRDRRTG